MDIFKLKPNDEYIELNNLLKVLGWVNTGGEAKNHIQLEDVIVNGEVEIRVRKKMRLGDTFQFGEERGKIA